MKNKIAGCAGLVLLFWGLAGAQQTVLSDAVFPGDSTAEAARPAAGTKPLTNARVVSLVKSGIDDAMIISLISQSPAEYDVSLEALANLHDAGVSNEVINAIKRRAPAPPPAKPAQDKPLTNDSLISLAQAGLGDANIIYLLNKSHGNFYLNPEEVVRLKNAGVGDAVIDAIKLKAETSGPLKIPSRKVSGFDVSFSYLALPVEYSYLEVTEQLTLANSYVNTVSRSEAGKSESFRLGSIGLRFAKMQKLNDSVSAGIEWGVSVPAGGKTYSYSAGQTVMGATQTVRYADNLETHYTKYGPMSSEVTVKSLVVPLFAKLDFKTEEFSPRDSFFVGTGLGTYFILNTLETMDNYWEGPNMPKQEKYTVEVATLLPAAEISLGGKFEMSNNIYFSVAGIMGYSLKGPIISSDEITKVGLSYKTGFKIGGLSYGGQAGFSFLF